MVPNAVIHVPTEEELDAFCDFCERNGITWLDITYPWTYTTTTTNINTSDAVDATAATLTANYDGKTALRG